ncbi:MAG: short-chain dehydrogenase/reductase SDR [Acidobacteria bacterium OLB17]|nr:MAG: short-chain dehydrogenase/reductase SDR [Acidobacteria bacterium OLB17]MCZ2392163.1 SDR family oxidoreductase [Acidobacteriota bacterium]
MRFDGKTIVVTGGALGIGKAACSILAERGGNVSIIDWDEDAGNAAREAITASGSDAMFTKADVSDLLDLEKAIAATAERFGRIDSLIVSAGIQRYGTAVTTTDEQWDEVLGVNLNGAWNAARLAIPYLRAAGSGSIVNISSVQALASQQNVLAYTVSKHALIGLTRSIAMDFAKERIRANAVCPGTVDTPMLEWAASLDPDPRSVYDACNRMHPLGRIAQPREIAEVAVFLAHENSSFVTGSVWTADGGLLTQIGGVPQTN